MDWIKQTWHFIWDDDSIWSWLVNIVLAFILIKYIVYPGLGLALHTSFPVVAVVSNSMYHDASFDTWWNHAKDWYLSQGISKEQFETFSMKNGFRKGDIMVLYGFSAEKIGVGDVIVYQARKTDPIIHRVTSKREKDNKVYYQTKGDNYMTNPVPIQASDLDETQIPYQTVQGLAVLRIPYLGWVKILAIRSLCFTSVILPQNMQQQICAPEYRHL